MKQNIAVLAISLLPTLALAAPSAEVWPHWQKSNSASTATIDHSDWNSLLKTHVKKGGDGINYVAYKQFSAADKAKLASYIDKLEATDIANYNRNEQRAYWINLYNATTVNVILEHYPVKSIRDIDISPGIFSSGPWKKKLLEIDGQEVSLDDVEHRILRPIWKDARIHYAVNCASIGCPNLSAQAFTAANSDSLLTQGAKAYVNHERGVSVNGSSVKASSIYKWFKEDFGSNDKEVIQHFTKYANADLKAKLANATSIDSYHYDWNLNEK